MRATDDQRGPLPFRLRGAEGPVHGFEVVAVGQVLDEPAVGLEALADVFLAESEIGGAFDSDVVVVVQEDQIVEPEETRDRRRFRRHALHQVAVTADAVDLVVDDLVSGPVEERPQVFSGDGHTHRIAEALAQRTGRGLNARGQQVLGMAGSPTAPLAKLLVVVQREVIAGQVQQAVKQHATVARREDGAVSVRPVRLPRVVPEESRPQDVGHSRSAHGQSGMARVRLLDRVHGKTTDGVDRELVELSLVEC